MPWLMILGLALMAGCGDDRCHAPLVEVSGGVCHFPEAGHPVPVAGSETRETFYIIERDAGTRVADADSGSDDESGRGFGGVGGGNPDSGSDRGGAGEAGVSALASVAGAGISGGGGVGVGGMLAAGRPAPEPVCGNGIVEGDELCDGNCPSCDDGDPCTADYAGGSRATCDAACGHKPITAAITGDKCCPKDATASADGDCVCRADFDCGTDEYCSASHCHTLACAGDGDCTDERWCTSTGQCALRRPGLCTRPRQCPAGHGCGPGPNGFSECD